MSGYSDSKTPPKPPIERIGPYAGKDAPAGATFNKGAQDINSINEMLEARRRRSAELSNGSGGPRTSGHHDSRGV
jgi:hypothetical protein